MPDPLPWSLKLAPAGAFATWSVRSSPSGSDAETWIDEGLRFAVMDRADAEGLARDDPGAVYPNKVGEVRNVGDGAEVVLVGRRSTQWYSGADAAPPPAGDDLG